jgi:hypothetical protein
MNNDTLASAKGILTKDLVDTQSKLEKQLLDYNVHNILIDSVTDMDEQKVSNQEQALNALDADLMTTRRQVEIINNGALIKDDMIAILKFTFTMVSLAFLNLQLNNTEYKKYVFYALLAITLLYFASKLAQFSIKHVNRWTVNNYPLEILGRDGSNLNTSVEPEDECELEQRALEEEIKKNKKRILDKLIAIKERQLKVEETQKTLIETKNKMENRYNEFLSQAQEIYNNTVDSKLSMTNIEKENLLKSLKEEYKNKYGVNLETSDITKLLKSKTVGETQLKSIN